MFARRLIPAAVCLVALLAAPWSFKVAGRAVAARATQIDTRALLHDSWSAFYRSPFGAVPAGGAVRLRLRTARHGATSVVAEVRFENPTDVNPKVRTVAELKMGITRSDTKHDYWQGTFKTSALGIYTYAFLVRHGTAHVWYGNNLAAYGGVGHAYGSSPGQYFQITSYAPGFKAVPWARDMVIYQIFPDRFFNGDPSNDRTVENPQFGHTVPTFESGEDAVPLGTADFFGGDLQGIIDKLPYLKALGVNTLYLNPIFLAPSSHKYDTANYFEIDPHFGTMQTFLNLVQSAHAVGMHLILDGVFNHTGSDSVYFNRYGNFPDLGAYQSKNSPYYPWYTFQLWPDAYNSFDPNGVLPQLNESSAVKDFIFRKPDSVAQYWLAQGADGWRLDVTQGKSHQWWQQFRTALKSRFPDDIIICECTGGPIDATPWLLGNEDDGDMNYNFRDAILRFFARGAGSTVGLPATAGAFYDNLFSMIEEYPLPALESSMNLVGSHDTSRILTELRGKKSELRQVAAFQMTWLGAPTIYYGDEAGRVDAPSPDSTYVSRNFFPWSHQDTQLEAFYTKLIGIRMANPALRDGTVSPLVLNDGARIVSFLRSDSRQSVAVVVNDGSAARAVTLKLAAVPNGTVLTDALGGKRYTVRGHAITVRAAAVSTAILAQSPRP
ncbi:MAG TPA: glycoside hydrolase family 13 protein [Chloroflexota bacterium]|nr:glycoside hydrolase family 13 protein [Chloroflexota bacterium]